MTGLSMACSRQFALLATEGTGGGVGQLLFRFTILRHRFITIVWRDTAEFR